MEKGKIVEEEKVENPTVIDSKLKTKAKTFVDKHAEIWKFIKFTFTGVSTSVLEMAVHMLFIKVVFASLSTVPVVNPILSFLKIEYKGALYAYFLSTTIGYAAAFIMNRKLTFKADGNATKSIVLYAIMVVCTIFINSWIGSTFTTLAIANGYGDNTLVQMIIKLVVMTIPTLWTYPLNRFVIHKQKKIK